jgi:hypothetical protein
MKTAATVVAAVAVSTAATILYEVNVGRTAYVPVSTFLVVYLTAFGITSAFAAWTASEIGLPSYLVLFPESAWERLRRLLVWGGLFGLLIAAGNGLVALLTDGAVSRPWYLRDQHGTFDILVLSARTAFAEETLFRLFSIPFMASIALRLRHGWRPRRGPWRQRGANPSDAAVSEPAVAPSRWLVAGSVLASAAVFALRHPFNPVPAFTFGVLLGIVYLRGGWESAVTAHFVGNSLVFMALYR